MIQRPLQALSDTSIHRFGELKGNLTSFHMRVPTIDVMDAPLSCNPMTTRLSQCTQNTSSPESLSAGNSSHFSCGESLPLASNNACTNSRLLGDADLAQNAAGGSILLEDVQQALPHLAGLLRSIDLLPDAGVAVVVNDRASLVVVGTETLAESALVVVGTLDERLAGHIVDHAGLRRVEDLVVRAAGGGVHKATGDTGNKKLVGDLELDGVLQRLVLGLEHAVELDGLGNGAREAVEDEARHCVSTAGSGLLFHNPSNDIPVLALLVVVQLVLDHANHDLIRHQLALIHNLLGLATELGLSGDLRAQHVAGGQVASAVLFLDLRGLSTLACRGLISELPLSCRNKVLTSAGRANEDHAHAIDGRLGASVRLAKLALELVNSALQRVDVALELLDDLFGRHDVCCFGTELT
jgi:hypothetical protein